MTDVVLTKKMSDGTLLSVTYLPERGMNMTSYKKGDTEVIDQSTRPLFEERSAGLGAMIGPHFHRRRYEILPAVLRDSSSPFFDKEKKTDPFSHGVGRYASWTYERGDDFIRAILKGSDTLHNFPLKELEGRDFTMKYAADLTEEGLKIRLSVVSDTDSLVGIHHYYRCDPSRSKVFSRVKETYIAEEKKLLIPEEIGFDPATRELVFDLHQEADFTFRPFPDPTRGVILLDAGDYRLKTEFFCDNEECSWQLWHPKGAGFVCIEPISSQNPRRPNLTVSTIGINLQIL